VRAVRLIFSLTAARWTDGVDYPSLCYLACDAELAFGQQRFGGLFALFAKRKDDAGNYFEDNGWRSFNRGLLKRALRLQPADLTPFLMAVRVRRVPINP
jgi:hypothetical protein